VRPFGLATLYPRAERTLLALLGEGTRYGITPGEGWEGGEDPWMAPTAWSAWALAGLAAEARRDGLASKAATDRRAALKLMTDLRRAATPAGALPERVDTRTGVPTSTTPLLWSSAFAVLALRELWP
jgi:GH15 family glucan-1,4-alpha-glucosidase